MMFGPTFHSRRMRPADGPSNGSETLSRIRSLADYTIAMLESSFRKRQWPGSLDHVLRDTGLSDLKAEFEQLAMDARGAPQWIVNAHPSDQRAQARVELRSASEGAGFPPPISPEAGSVPAHQGLRPDDRGGLQDRCKPP